MATTTTDLYRTLARRFSLSLSLPKRIIPVDGHKWQAPLDEIKQALIGPDIMLFPTDSDLYILDCDAPDDFTGCVLSQKQSNVEKVIAYGS